MRLFLLFLVVASALALDQVFAQQPQQPPDPDLLAVKLDGCSNLLDAREKQLVEATRQIVKERAYYAAWVAGDIAKTGASEKTQ
jgi:hypothetical protein